MPADEPPEDDFDAELEKIRSKTAADSADKKEEADVLKAQAEAELVQESVRGLKQRRATTSILTRCILWGTVLYLPVPVILTLLQGFHYEGFALDTKIIVASYVPLAFGPLVGVLRALRNSG